MRTTTCNNKNKHMFTHCLYWLSDRLCPYPCPMPMQVDTMSTSEGQGAEETREYVADLVSRQLNLEGFRLQPEQVWGGVEV